MRTWNDLSEEERQLAVDKTLCDLVGNIVEGAIRFDDKLNGDNFQASLDEAIEEANQMRTPWFAGEHILDAVFKLKDDQRSPVRKILETMAWCDAEDAYYPAPHERIVRV